MVGMWDTVFERTGMDGNLNLIIFVYLATERVGKT